MERKKKSKFDGRSIFDIISEKFFFLLKSGIFGKFFTSYDEANERYLRSRKRKKKTVGQRKFKKRVSRTIEGSVLVNNVPRFVEWLLRISTRNYGIMLFTVGVIIASLYPLNGYILIMNATFTMLISGISVGVLGIPLLCSKKSISTNIYNSRLCNRLLFDFLGLDKEKMRQVSEKPCVSIPNLAILVGIFLSILSIFVMPLKLIAIIGILILSYCVLCRPEVGVLVTVIILPFASLTTLLITVIYVFVCYVLKCITGKRTFKFEHFDIWVVLTLLAILIGGAVSTNWKVSIPTAISTVSLILIYFVITNLIRSKEWFRRCLISLVFSGTAVAIIGIVQVILGKLSVNFPQLTKLFTNGQSAIGMFDNPNTFAHFLIAIIPFSIVHFISERSGRKKISGVLITAIMLVAMCLANSLSGVVGIVFATLLLLTIFNRNYAYLTLIICTLCPVLYFTLPSNALEKLLSTKMLEGVSAINVISKTREGFQLFLKKPFGIGSGEEIFKTVFGTNEGYFDNLILQYLIEYGIVAFAVFVIFVIMLIRLTFSYCAKAKNQYRKINCCAGFCAVTGLIVSGVVNYTWYDKRIFLMFWILVAFSFAYVRIEREEEEPEGLIDDYTIATLDIALDEDAHYDEIPRRRYVRVPKNVGKNKKEELDENEKERRYEEFENSSEFKIVGNSFEKPLEILDATDVQIEITDTSPNQNNANSKEIVDETSDETANGITNDKTDEITDELIQDVIEETVAETVTEPIDDTINAPVSKSIDGLIDKITDETTDETIEETIEETTEEKTEEKTEETTGGSDVNSGDSINVEMKENTDDVVVSDTVNGDGNK